MPILLWGYSLIAAIGQIHQRISIEKMQLEYALWKAVDFLEGYLQKST